MMIMKSNMMMMMMTTTTTTMTTTTTTTMMMMMMMTMMVAMAMAMWLLMMMMMMIAYANSDITKCGLYELTTFCNIPLLLRGTSPLCFILTLWSLSLAHCCALAQAPEFAIDKGSLPVKLSMVAELRSLWFSCLSFACKHASASQKP